MAGAQLLGVRNQIRGNVHQITMADIDHPSIYQMLNRVEDPDLRYKLLLLKNIYDGNEISQGLRIQCEIRGIYYLNDNMRWKRLIGFLHSYLGKFAHNDVYLGTYTCVKFQSSE